MHWRIFVCLGLLVSGNVTAGLFDPTVVTGYVYSRALVYGPNGKPILVEYGDQGEVLRVLGEMTGDFADAYILSAQTFTAMLDSFYQFREQHQDGSARGATLLTDEAYGKAAFQTLDGQSIDKPGLSNGTQSVYVRGPRTLLTKDTNPVLLESPLNLTLYASGFQLPAGARSLVIGKNGEILARSTYNFGYRAAYAQNGEGECTPETATAPENDRNNLINVAAGERPCGPVAGAKISTFSPITGDVEIATDSKGFFTLSFLNSSCVGFDIEYTNPIAATLYYSDFNPKRGGGDLFFTEFRDTYNWCFGSYVFAPGGIPPLNSVINRVRFPVDVIALTGTGSISNEDPAGQTTKPLPFGPTEHGTNLPIFTEQIPVGLDLDADGREDQAMLYQGKVYVYLGGRNIETDADGAPINADLTRLPDQLTAGGLPDTSHQGLLSQISKEDLQQTDLYVYRVSTGERIGELRGLKENDFRDGILDEDGGWYYRMQLATGFNPESRQQVGWRSSAQVDDNRYEKDADHLRPGESLKLVAINRKTGYIGTAVTQIQAAQEGKIDFPVSKIVLRPPNLRISAERQYRVQSGLTQGEDRNYLIGFEGSALTSDQYIAVTTEWFDHDGTPLPGDLPGYTGRLAQLVAPNTLGESQVGHFQILPGRRLQLVALNGEDIQNQHYYVHVSGYPKDENPDFTTLGAGQGVLQYRPKYYVPFMVPIYNEQASRAEQNAYNQALQRFESGQISQEPEKPTPTYVWAYRPEMQFSVFDLKQQQLRLEYEKDGLVQVINLVDAKVADIATIFTEADYVDIFYSLHDPDLSPLESFGPERELVLALGDREVELMLDPNGHVRLDDLDRFVALNPEDFLALQLYQNSDTANILWEYVITARLIQHSLAQAQQIPVDTETFNAAETTAKLQKKPDWLRAIVKSLGIEDFTLESLVRAVQNGLVSEAIAAEIISGQHFSGTYTGNFDDSYFYPDLGNKKIFVDDECQDGSAPLHDGDTVTFHSAVFKDTKEPVPDVFKVLPTGPVGFKYGFAKFIIEGNSKLVPYTDEDGNPRKIALRFLIEAHEGCSKPYTDKGGYNVEIGEIIIKNNSNTTVAEVLEGKGIFVQQKAFDSSEAGQNEYRRDGRSYGRQVNGKTVLDEQDQYFDYAQYMMNMVAIPLRVPVQESNLEYLITPDGKYGDNSAALLKALMVGGNHTVEDKPSFKIKENIGIISYHEGVKLNAKIYTAAGFITTIPGKSFLTFEKLRRDYQRNDVTSDILLELPSSPLIDPPMIAADELRYQVITPEVFRGVDAVSPLDYQSKRLISDDGEFINPQDIGIYQLFKHYDWDGDGVSNLAEVENATQFNTAGTITIASNIFDPLLEMDMDLGQQMKTAYSRGNVSITGSSNAPSPTSPGLGELSAANGMDVPGLRLPTFGPGFYDFPNIDPLNIDAYTSARVLNLLESAGRSWANDRPDTYPLEDNPLVHNTQSDPAHAGNLRFGLNDLSGRAGGVNRASICTGFALRADRTIPYTCSLDHASHNNGLDMDIRYVRNDNTESVVKLGATNDDAVFDVQATIDLINAITNDGNDLALLIIGDRMDAVSSGRISDAFPNTTIIENKDHNNHIHVRLTAESESLPDPNRFTVITTDLQLEYVMGNTEAAIASSTHTIDFQVFDMNGNPLLPWTRMSYQSSSTVATVTGLNLVNNTLYDAGRVWINIGNQADRQGYGSVRVQCTSVGAVNVTLSDAAGNNVGMINAQCQ